MSPRPTNATPLYALIWLLVLALIFVVSLLLAGGCTSAAAQATPNHPAPVVPHVIADVRLYPNAPEWRRTPWYRADQDEPIPDAIAIIIDTSNYGCIVDHATWATAQVGDHFECPTAWRAPRYRLPQG